MAKLRLETAQTIWDLQHQLLEIIDTAKTLESSLFEAFGESDSPQERLRQRTIPYLDELQSIAQQATERFSRFSTLQIRVANTQPPILRDILEIVDLSIESTQQKIPALRRSNQETIQEFNL